VRFEVLTSVSVKIAVLECYAFSTMKMEAGYSSEMMVFNYQTIQCHVPEDFKLTSFFCTIFSFTFVLKVFES
jgi:hypothetical protein